MKKEAKFVSIIFGLCIIAALVLITSCENPLDNKNTEETTLENQTQQDMSQIAEKGDLAEIDYVLRLENGTVVDTNNPELAEQAGLKNYQKGTYKFIIGQSGKVKGFDEAIEGIKFGETVDRIILPSQEELFIEKNLTNEIHRYKALNRAQAFKKENFQKVFGKPPIINDVVYNFDIFPWKYQIYNITEEAVIGKIYVREGEKYQLPGMPWNATVFQVYTDVISFFMTPNANQTIDTDFGEAEVSAVRSKIYVTLDPQVGDVFEIPTKGIGGFEAIVKFQVIERDDKKFVIKRIGILEDKTLDLEVTLKDLTKDVKEVKNNLKVKETSLFAR